MMKVIFDCHRATFLVEKKLMGKITFQELVELLSHLIGCRVCRVYASQSELITSMIASELKTTL